MTNEIYRLTLEHYIDDNKKRFMIEEPIVVQMIHKTEIPTPVCLNCMFDKMRDELLKKEGEK